MSTCFEDDEEGEQPEDPWKAYNRTLRQCNQQTEQNIMHSMLLDALDDRCARALLGQIEAQSEDQLEKFVLFVGNQLLPSPLTVLPFFEEAKSNGSLRACATVVLPYLHHCGLQKVGDQVSERYVLFDKTRGNDLCTSIPDPAVRLQQDYEIACQPYVGDMQDRDILFLRMNNVIRKGVREGVRASDENLEIMCGSLCGKTYKDQSKASDLGSTVLSLQSVYPKRAKRLVRMFTEVCIQCYRSNFGEIDTSGLQKYQVN